MTFAAAQPADTVYAALDLGTNNCRMLAARPHGRTFKVVDSFSRITRLGEGLARTGRLSAEAMERTLDALRHCADRMARSQVGRARLVATEACRRAANHAEFAGQVTRETGLNLDIISPAEEAALALAGCAPLLRAEHARALVFDIGGGSTELLWVDNGSDGPKIDGLVSLAIGVVTLAESRGAALCDPGGYAEVVADVAARLAPFEARHGVAAHLQSGTIQMLGTSGTVTTLAALHLDLERYDRGAVDGLDMDFADVAAVTRRLLAMSAEERARNPCVGPQRADLVLAGCAILEAVCRLWPLGRLRVADRGVREGVLLTMMRADVSSSAGARR
ncbi:MAG: Ppx/GppA phosphatase family protein [Magnetospirillum sp.]|nr:Ppx/GppA phosphatase family protein [Magnetospirillum sp.]